MARLQNKLKVASNQKISPRLYHLSFEKNLLCQKVKPGQFIHIKVSEGLMPFFRRPFSVARAKNNIEIIYDVVGNGTRLLSQKKQGDVLDILGPLGNHFDLPPKNVSEVFMIAGGVGVAPLLFLSDALRQKKIKTTLLYGARNKDYVFNLNAFKVNGCKVHISTDDGSVGTKGRVAKLFSKIKGARGQIFIYTCGPKPMMTAVQEFAKKQGFKGQASAEEVMACGLGACLGCSIKTTKGYRTVCHDGPVFDLEEMIF